MAFLLIYTIITATITVCENGLIICCWIFDKSVRTSSNALLVALAVFDFMVGAFVTPVMYATDFFYNWPFGKVACTLYVMFINSVIVVSSNTLVLISIDRYRLLVEGVPYIQRRSPLTAVKPVGLIIIVSIWLQIDSILDFERTMIYKENSNGICQCFRNYQPTFGLIITLFDTILPALCLIFINVAIFRELKKRNQAKLCQVEHGIMSSTVEGSVYLQFEGLQEY